MSPTESITDKFALAVIEAVRRRIWHVLAIIFGTVLAFIAISFAVTPRYTAIASFLPETRTARDMAFLSDLFAVGSLFEGGGSEEALYGRILTSDRLLDPLLDVQWRPSGESPGRTLADILDRAEADGNPAEQRASLKRWLRTRAIEFSRDKHDGFMRLSVTVPEDPHLAADMANHLIDALSRHLDTAQRSDATERRQFLEQRLTVVSGELADAERRRVDFETANRGYATSPSLASHQRDLVREAEASATVWAELRRQLELSRIEEANESVRINILDRAHPPIHRSAPNRTMFALSGVFMGFCLAAGYLLFASFRERFGRGATVNR